MSETLSERIIQVRAPARLVNALEAEARRRMVPKSVLVRWALAEKLGLLDQTGENKRDADREE